MVLETFRQALQNVWSMRRTAALQDTDEHLFLKVVNPLRYPKEGEECELFRSTDKVRMAWEIGRAHV